MASDVSAVREMRIDTVIGVVISKKSCLAWIAAARSVADPLRSGSKPR